MFVECMSHVLMQPPMVGSINVDQKRFIMEALNVIGHGLCDRYNVSCCIDQYPKHLNFQCKLESMPIIASYHNNEIMTTDMKAAEEFTIVMGILEIVMFNIDKARSLTPRLATTLEQLLKLFCKNTYILEYYNNLVAIKERSNGLQEQEEYREEEKVLEDCPYPYSPCYFDSDSDDDQHIQNDFIIDNSFESDEEFHLDILYDNALHDGPI